MACNHFSETNMTKVFIIPFHVKRAADSILPPDASGAYVSCYAAGKDYVEAVQKALRQLGEDGLRAEEILEPVHEMKSESWARHVLETWADQAAGLPNQARFEAAMKDGEVIYGPIGTYD